MQESWLGSHTRSTVAASSIIAGVKISGQAGNARAHVLALSFSHPLSLKLLDTNQSYSFHYMEALLTGTLPYYAMFKFPVLLTSHIDLFLMLFILIRLEPTRLFTKLASHRQGGDVYYYKLGPCKSRCPDH